MPLTNHTTLVVAEGVSLVRKIESWDVLVSGESLRGGRYTLAILDVFSTPNTFKRGIEQLTQRLASTPAWIEVIATVKALHGTGILVEPGAVEPLRKTHASRFDSAPVHITMLDDSERTTRFQSAIRQVVKPGDVVLDIGTGTGVLAITAAQAGARHVYALEATSMSASAHRMVAANGLDDRVTVIRAHSFDINLPERADVLVSEIIGDDPLGEQIVPTFADARRRLLAEGARAIPARLKIQVLPVVVPPDHVARLRFTATRSREWEKRYGIDFSALVAGADEQDHRVKVNSYTARGWQRCSGSLTVANLDLLARDMDIIDAAIPFVAQSDAAISGALVFFEAELANEILLSIAPDEATATNSWGTVLQLFAAPIDVRTGEQLEVRYRYDDRGSRVELNRPS